VRSSLLDLPDHESIRHVLLKPSTTCVESYSALSCFHDCRRVHLLLLAQVDREIQEVQVLSAFTDRNKSVLVKTELLVGKNNPSFQLHYGKK